MARVSVIVPTYNERENIEKIVKSLSGLGKEIEIIIVDDGSPDGTGTMAEELKKKFSNLKVIHREGERGLASAVVEGFRAANADIIGVMDADLSHPVDLVPEMISLIKGGDADLVIGSRYVPGGHIEGWGLMRKFTSKGAILLARPLTPIRDSVSGFFFMKKTVIQGITLNPKGYKISLEIIVKGNYDHPIEIPYTFVNRKKGKSKLNLREYIYFLEHLARLYYYRMRALIK